MSGGRLFTVGYEGRTLEGYLDLLSGGGVTLLCDVRRNPISRKPGFSRKALAAACARMGIRYEHLPELGIPSEKRRAVKTQADRDALLAEYERTTLVLQKEAVLRVACWVQEGLAVALTCFEADPARCHRHFVAGAVGRALGVRASHL